MLNNVIAIPPLIPSRLNRVAVVSLITRFWIDNVAFNVSKQWCTLGAGENEALPTFTINGQGELGNLGLTELFFETVEPPNADVSIAEMLTVLPAGNYTIEGPAIEAGENKGPTRGVAWMTHNIPAGPGLLSPEEDAVVSADEDLVVSWSPVTKTIDDAEVNLRHALIVLDRHPWADLTRAGTEAPSES